MKVESSKRRVSLSKPMWVGPSSPCWRLSRIPLSSCLRYKWQLINSRGSPSLLTIANHKGAHMSQMCGSCKEGGVRVYESVSGAVGCHNIPYPHPQ